MVHRSRSCLYIQNIVLAPETSLPDERYDPHHFAAAMHIADVFQRPMVVLYPGTDATSTWHPRSTSARVLNRPASCSLCAEPDCCYGMKCFDIRPEEVVIAVLEMLGEQTYASTTDHVLQEYRSEMSGT